MESVHPNHRACSGCDTPSADCQTTPSCKTPTFGEFLLADFTATRLGKDRLAVVIGTPWPGVITVVGITKNLKVNRSPFDCPLNGRVYPWLLPRFLRMPVGMAIDVMADACRAINAGNVHRPRLRPNDEATLRHFVRLATSS